MLKVLERVGAVFDQINVLLARLGALLFGFITLTTSAEVVMRYFLNRPTLWTLETAEYSVAFIAFLGAPWVLAREGHVTLDVVLNRLPSERQALLNVGTSVFGAFLCLVIVWFGSVVTLDCFQRGVLQPTVLEPPKFLLLAVVPVSFFLLFVQFLRRTHLYLRSWKALRHERHGLESAE